MAQLFMIGSRIQQGFAYMAVLTVIACSAITLSVALPDIYQQAQREREAQLIFAGLQYQQAIKRFYENPNTSVKRFPTSIEELLIDKRSPRYLHHLRRAYRDPMTQSGEWDFIYNKQRQIIGVKSQSQQVPIKTKLPAGIDVQATTAGVTYASLRFIYEPTKK